ncbi:MAG: hypothetical protein BJ554DRAFT_2704 [Olpidium bornovanus]|uniref:MORN repeat-containing protein 3 n=1 Tax=Olpidium bornovanus TaxID=278681 RepID=A0A8H7ZQD3_9FUNG|nr:MAG: hypothetical protein BJ554DRAFT_2704 [Olpidium bornovanus]
MAAVASNWAGCRSREPETETLSEAEHATTFPHPPFPPYSPARPRGRTDGLSVVFLEAFPNVSEDPVRGAANLCVRGNGQLGLSACLGEIASRAPVTGLRGPARIPLPDRPTDQSTDPERELATHETRRTGTSPSSHSPPPSPRPAGTVSDLVPKKKAPGRYQDDAGVPAIGFGRRTTRNVGRPSGGVVEPAWHERDRRSEKNGPHAMVYLINGDTYLGEWKANMKHGLAHAGKGTYTCARTGSVYEGEWVNGCREGYGTFSVRLIPPEDLEEGESSAPGSSRKSSTAGSFSSSTTSDKAGSLPACLANSKTASALSLLLSNRAPESPAAGSERVGGADDTIFATVKRRPSKTAYPLRKVYAGGWKGDKRCGFGTYYYADGSYYEGEWEDGVMKGWGTMHYSDGSRYDGEWFDEKRHGQGILLLREFTLVLAVPPSIGCYDHFSISTYPAMRTAPMLDRYEGMWLNDQKEGPGKFIYKVRRQAYDGEWVMGMPKCGMLVDLPPLPSKSPGVAACGVVCHLKEQQQPQNCVPAFISAEQAQKPANWLMLGGRRIRYPIPEVS